MTHFHNVDALELTLNTMLKKDLFLRMSCLHVFNKQFKHEAQA